VVEKKIECGMPLQINYTSAHRLPPEDYLYGIKERVHEWGLLVGSSPPDLIGEWASGSKGGKGYISIKARSSILREGNIPTRSKSEVSKAREAQLLLGPTRGRMAS